MKARHKKAGGGEASDMEGEAESKGHAKEEKYTPEDKVEAEAEERGEKKHGGRVKKAKKADGGKVEGCAPKMRLDRKQRKSGGRVGSDLSPFSSAHKVGKVVEHKTDEM